MRKYILIGAAAFAIFAIALMPASIVRVGTDRVDGLELRTVGGTVWDGRAQPVYRGQSIGDLAWALSPVGVLAGEARVRWQLTESDSRLNGIAAVSLSGARLTASGRIGAATINRVLGRYDIRIGGDFEVAYLTMLADGTPRLAGSLAWSGGRTFYRLSGQSYDTSLPPMIASLATSEGEYTLDAALAADAAANSAPLIQARLKPDGWVAISITRRFTALAGKPWPVPGDDDAVVLTVEERIFHGLLD